MIFSIESVRVPTGATVVDVVLEVVDVVVEVVVDVVVVDDEPPEHATLNEAFTPLTSSVVLAMLAAVLLKSPQALTWIGTVIVHVVSPAANAPPLKVTLLPLAVTTPPQLVTGGP